MVNDLCFFFLQPNARFLSLFLFIMTVGCHKNGIKHKRQVSLKTATKPHCRFTTPDYSVQSLMEQMNSYIQKAGAKGALDLQSYRNIKLSCAVSGRGILQNKALVQVLINVCPYALYKVSDLKSCFVEMAHEFDELTGLLPKSTDRWAGEMAERVMVLLNHVRRLRNSDIRLRQACGKLDIAGCSSLKNIVNQVIPSDELVSMMSPKSKLSSHDDDIDDIPDSMSVGFLKLVSQEPVPPAKLPKPVVKALGKTTKPDAPSPPVMKPKPADGIKIFATFGAQQSYIQYATNSNPKKTLLVGVSAKMASKHKDIVKLMYSHFQAHPSCDKKLALSLRAALLE